LSKEEEESEDSIVCEKTEPRPHARQYEQDDGRDLNVGTQFEI
jgi:hypothetical protein